MESNLGGRGLLTSECGGGMGVDCGVVEKKRILRFKSLKLTSLHQIDAAPIAFVICEV